MPADGLFPSVTTWLRTALWMDVQGALWAALLLPLAAALAHLLRGRLPVWRKGLWLGAMLLPLLLSAAAAISPVHSTALVPLEWLVDLPGEADTPRDAASIAIVAACAYSAWLMGNLLVELGAAVRLGRIIRRSAPVGSAGVVGLYTELVRATGCVRPPRLLLSDQVASPFIVGGPVGGLSIILPTPLAQLPPSSDALRAVLAHELAHARAADPYVQRLLALLRCLAPLTWLCALGAIRTFWEDAAEQTGDLRALRGSGLSEARYASVLKDLALGEPAPAMALAFTPPRDLPPAAQGLASALISRLRSLRLAARWSESLASAGAAGRALVVAGLLVVLASQTNLRQLLNDPRDLALAPTPVEAPAPATARPHAALPPDARRIKARETRELRKLEEKPSRRDAKAARRNKAAENAAR